MDRAGQVRPARPARSLAEVLVYCQHEGFEFGMAWYLACGYVPLADGEEGDRWAELIGRYKPAWEEQWNAGSLPQMASVLAAALERIEKNERPAE